MEYTNNRVLVRGTLGCAPEFSHENHGRRFFQFSLQIARLSGTVDTLQVLAPEDVLAATELCEGSSIEVTGQVRSFNSRRATGRRLIITIYAEQINICDGEDENQVELTGTICKAPIFRRTPLGREICDVMLAVSRPYRRTDYLPCILWGRTAEAVSLLPVGTALHLTGRLQSRAYIKVLEQTSEKRIAYEISAVSAEPVTASVPEAT